MDVNKNLTFDDGWIFIKPYLDNIFELFTKDITCIQCNYSNKDYMKIFTLIYNMCNGENKYYRKNSSNLYVGISHYLYSKIRYEYKYWNNEYFNKTDRQMIFNNLIKCMRYHHIAKWISKFTSYLDRFYTKHNELPPMLQVMYYPLKLELQSEICPIVNIIDSNLEPIDFVQKYISEVKNEWVSLIESQRRLSLCHVFNNINISNDSIIKILEYIPKPKFGLWLLKN